MKKGSEQWYNAQKNINDFTANIAKASAELIDLQDKLHQIQYDTLQNIIDGFARTSDKISAYVDLLESRDETVPEDLYQQQIDSNNAQIQKQYELRSKYLKEQELYDVNSERYQELAEKINDADTEVLKLQKDNEDLKDSIYDLRMKNIDEAIQKYSDLENELSGFRDLLNEDAFLDKNGGITDEGLAQITLLSQSLGNAKQQIADYTTGLQKLKEMYDNGLISMDEYNDKTKEYRDGIQGATKDVKSYNDSLIELYKKSMQSEVDYLNKIIDKRKKALQAKADYYNYDKKIKSQTKDINSLKAQIAALESVNNLSAQSQKKKLQEQLKEAEEELADTKHSHAVDMQTQGYESMSDDLNQMLEDTEYEITHNADKQIEIINNMLNKQVSMYQEAYEKINSIIKNTGWVGSDAFNNNQSSMSTSDGAANQTGNASQSQTTANTKPSSSASGTKTDGIKDNASGNQKITEDIMKPENTTNRPVAELKVSTNSVTIEEGKSTSVKTTIRPNDAANKTLNWGSSNLSIATASNGTINGVKPGSCQVIVSTTDGSGITQTISVTVTKKPDPPKPTPTPSHSNGGDGIPRVGDVCTYTGTYYYDSWGQRPLGNLYSGVPNGVVIDSYSSVEYGGQAKQTGDLKVHIKTADGKYSDLGWVRLSQLTGYANGTTGVPKDGVYWTDEEGPELVIPPTKKAKLTNLQKASGVISNPATLKLMAWADKLDENGDLATAQAFLSGNIVNPYKAIGQEFVKGATATIRNINNSNKAGNITVNQSYDSLFTIKGDVTRETFPGVKKMCEESYKYTSKEIAKDLTKLGYKSKR